MKSIDLKSLLNKDRRKLIATLVMNVVARLPGLATPFVVLPAANNALGTADYGQLLAILAIGGAGTLAFGGVTTTVRRWIGFSSVKGTRADEASAFWTALFVGFLIAATALVAIVVIVMALYGSIIWSLIAILPVIATWLTLVDGARAGYNEHYMTAALQAASQTLVVAAVLAFGLPEGGRIVSALVLSVPYAVASILACLLLFWQRPYLLSSTFNMRPRTFIKESWLATGSEGPITLVVNGVLFLLPTFGAKEVAAWFGTVCRVVLPMLSPIVLIVMPVATFIGVRWWNWQKARRLMVVRLFIAVGLGYGAIVGTVLATLGYIYIRRAFELGSSVSWLEHVLISVLFFGIVAHKTYGLLVMSFESPGYIARGTPLAAVASVFIGGLSLLLFGATVGLVTLCVVFGVLLVAVFLFDASQLIARLRR